MKKNFLKYIKKREKSEIINSANIVTKSAYEKLV